MSVGAFARRKVVDDHSRFELDERCSKHLTFPIAKVPSGNRVRHLQIRQNPAPLGREKLMNDINSPGPGRDFGDHRFRNHQLATEA